MDAEWTSRFVITGLVAVVAFFLKRSLDRIETKLDVFAAVQAQHALLLDRYENRVKQLEEKIGAMNDKVRQLSEGWIE